MKKVFPFSAPGHQPPRVVAAIKSDVRKYVKRERRKPLPEGVDFWDFDCKVGRTLPVTFDVSHLFQPLSRDERNVWSHNSVWVPGQLEAGIVN